jgi:hypothetical protein
MCARKTSASSWEDPLPTGGHEDIPRAEGLMLGADIRGDEVHISSDHVHVGHTIAVQRVLAEGDDKARNGCGGACTPTWCPGRDLNPDRIAPTRPST